MAKVNEIAQGMKTELIYQLYERYSKKVMENFLKKLGIVIKVIDKTNRKYNVYKDDVLVLASVSVWDVEYICKFVIANFTHKFLKSVEEDTALTETETFLNNLEENELKNNRENYYICGVCGAFVKRGTHGHF